MNIPANLFPHKHIRFCESLIGLAGYVCELLKEPLTIDELWERLNQKDSRWFYKPTFEQIVLSVVILFTLKQIKEIENNKLQVVSYHETA